MVTSEFLYGLATGFGAGFICACAWAVRMIRNGGTAQDIQDNILRGLRE